MVLSIESNIEIKFTLLLAQGRGASPLFAEAPLTIIILKN
jgi:hypothetical protein